MTRRNPNRMPVQVTGTGRSLRRYGRHPTLKQLQIIQSEMRTALERNEAHPGAIPKIHGGDPTLEIKGFELGHEGKPVIVVNNLGKGSVPEGSKYLTRIGPIEFHPANREDLIGRRKPGDRRNVFTAERTNDKRRLVQRRKDE